MGPWPLCFCSATGAVSGGGAFIEGADGGRISPSTAQKRIKRFYRVAAERGLRLPYITIENMRHSFATSYLHAGGNIEDLSRILGHSDIKTTARYYLRPDLSVLRSLQRAWERLIIGAA